MLDITKPLIRKKPDEIIVYVGCKDITNNINLVTNVKKVNKMMKDDTPETKLSFSSTLIRKDKKDIKEHTIREINSHLKNYCQQNNKH